MLIGFGKKVPPPSRSTPATPRRRRCPQCSPPLTRSDAAPSGAAAEHDLHGANDRGATRARAPLAKNLAHRANPVVAMRDACAFAVRAAAGVVRARFVAHRPAHRTGHACPRSCGRSRRARPRSRPRRCPLPCGTMCAGPCRAVGTRSAHKRRDPRPRLPALICRLVLPMVPLGSRATVRGLSPQVRGGRCRSSAARAKRRLQNSFHRPTD